MGTKFANFSVLSENMDEVIRLLGNIPTNDMTIETFEKGMMSVSPNHAPMTEDQKGFFSQLIPMLNQSRRTFWVGKNKKAVTVFSDSFDWGNIDSITRAFSKNTHEICFAVSVFDDDVLTLSVVRDGQELTRHISGEVTFYDLEPSPGDPNIFAEVFRLPDDQKDTLIAILNSHNEDLLDTVSELEELLNMSLWIIHEDDAKEKGWKKVIT